MQRDLDVLGRALGRSVDDAALTVHLVLHQMISLNGGQTGKMFCILMMRIVSVCYALRIFLVDDKEYYNNYYRAKTRSFPSSKAPISFFRKVSWKSGENQASMRYSFSCFAYGSRCWGHKLRVVAQGFLSTKVPWYFFQLETNTFIKNPRKQNREIGQRKTHSRISLAKELFMDRDKRWIMIGSWKGLRV